MALQGRGCQAELTLTRINDIDLNNYIIGKSEAGSLELERMIFARQGERG